MGRVSDAKQRLMQAAVDLISDQSYGSITVDAICLTAGVKKGSFYYFFRSKSHLALTAMEAYWQEKKTEMDAFFSPTKAPLERIHAYLEEVYHTQAMQHDKIGRMLGCPLITLGSEVCTQEEAIRLKVDEIMGHYFRYFESAIAEADTDGLLPGIDPEHAARILFSYYVGLMVLARIQNNPDRLRTLPDEALALITGNQVKLMA